MKMIANFDKIYSHFSKPDFDKKYSLFSKYAFDEEFKNNALDNSDLARKYEKYNQSIKSYLFELDKRFDIETIRNIIIETIIKYPDEIMISIITSYLNSDESVKRNTAFVSFYNKTSNFGKESIEYMQDNGIVLDRSYKDIPNIIIDNKYRKLDSYKAKFKDEALDDVYESLSYPERKFVITLIENNSFELLELLFGRFNFNIKMLIKILIKKGINIDLLNNDVIKELDAFPLMVLFCHMIEMEDSTLLVRNILELIKLKKYDLIKNIINNKLLDNLAYASLNEITNVDDEEVINLLKVKEKTLQITEEAA